MWIARTELASYGGETPSARTATARIGHRQGLLLHVVLRDGTRGQGEASPLPGYSPDTLGECRAALERWDGRGIAAPDPGENALAWLDRMAGALADLPAAARFAAETALLDAVARAEGVPLFALLRGANAPPRSVPLSAMVGGTDDPGSVVRARAAAERGIRTVKMKLAGPPDPSALHLLHAVRGAAPDARLRLDANGSLPLADAGRALAALVPLEPEFVEEPVPVQGLAGLGASPVPIALDESLQREGTLASVAPLLSALRCTAVVLKPTALGGLVRSLAIARHAERLGLDVTVSHTFEGPVALAAAAHFALAVASTERASGLDRHAGLGAWPAVELPFLGEAEILAVDRPGLGLRAFGGRE